MITVIMACTTNCVEKPIRSCLERVGRFIGEHPWWFIMVPLCLSVVLGVGFYFLEDRTSNDIVTQFTPRDGHAKLEKHFYQTLFQNGEDRDAPDGDDETSFSPLRLITDGRYASAIFTCGTNVLSEDALAEILRVDDDVKRMTVEHDGQEFSYGKLCARVNKSCQENVLLGVLGYNASNIHRLNLTFPVHHDDALGVVRLEHSVGQVEVDGNGFVQSAKAVRLIYYLRQTSSVLEEAWLNGFVDLLSNKSVYTTQVHIDVFISFESNCIPNVRFSGISWLAGNQGQFFTRFSQCEKFIWKRYGSSYQLLDLMHDEFSLNVRGRFLHMVLKWVALALHNSRDP